jgi:AcrR family transcriptional regulator
MSSEVSSREASKQETRTALIQAAMEEFAQRGLDGPSLDAICARAGYTRGAFYVHFKRRDELIIAVMERALGVFLDAIIATGHEENDLETTVERFVAAISDRSQTPEAPSSGAPDNPGDNEALQVLDVPFHQILEACHRSLQIRNSFVSLLGEAIRRVTDAAEAGQDAGRVRSDVASQDVGALLILMALGLETAASTSLPLDLDRSRDALLKLLTR